MSVLDEDGNQVAEIISNKTGKPHSVSTVLPAIGALQEAMTRIEELEAKVAALES